MVEIPEVLNSALGFTGIMLPVIGFALSHANRMKALARDNYTCQRADENCMGDLEASHISHLREEVNGVPYDDIRRVQILCTGHHLMFHKETHGHNGLSKQGNGLAMHLLKDKLRRTKWIDP